MFMKPRQAIKFHGSKINVMVLTLHEKAKGIIDDNFRSFRRESVTHQLPSDPLNLFQCS